jgi:hypothetical protein
MLDVFRLGGWGMFPTAIMGVVLWLAAMRYARRPDRAALLVVALQSVVTLLCGTLGFVSGLIRTLACASSGERPEPLETIIAGGLGESLHNIGLALVMMVVAAIATTIGALRATPPPAGVRGTPAL